MSVVYHYSAFNMAQAQYDDINIAVKYIIYEVNALDMYVLFVAILP